jgi:hypothetical protein
VLGKGTSRLCCAIIHDSKVERSKEVAMPLSSRATMSKKKLEESLSRQDAEYIQQKVTHILYST